MIKVYDEVPAMLYHVFDKEWFGKYFEQADETSSVKNTLSHDVVKWIKRERLEAGFTDGIIDQAHVIPLLKDQPAGKPKRLSKEDEIKEALGYGKPVGVPQDSD